jgi:hypothetical protein
MTSRAVASLTEDELVNVIRKAVRAEFSAAGLRVDEPQDQDQAKEDFRFIRRLRRGFDGASSKIGGAVILALVSGFLWLLWTGFHVILGKGQ